MCEQGYGPSGGFRREATHLSFQLLVPCLPFLACGHVLHLQSQQACIFLTSARKIFFFKDSLMKLGPFG